MNALPIALRKEPRTLYDGLTEVFSIRQGEWKLLLDGVMVEAEWNSKGAAEAAIEVERTRRARKAACS